MINFALCDDNAQVLSHLKATLESIFIKHDYDACIKYATTSVTDLQNFVNSNKVDVLFLDIELNSNFNGVDFAKNVRKTNKSIYLIFATGHFEYIVSALECKTFDFIQKPLTKSKIEKTVVRLFEDIEYNSTSFIKLSNRNELINQSLVNYIQKDGMKTIYNMNSGTVSSYGSFSNIVNNLPSNFVRCHKSFIVNMDNISNVDLRYNTIYFKDGSSSKCFIGPKYKNTFTEVLNNYGNIK